MRNRYRIRRDDQEDVKELFDDEGIETARWERDGSFSVHWREREDVEELLDDNDINYD